MKIINRNKKYGFSLMELTLAVLIVAILIVITLPIINRQLEKSEEYSYFMAYKSVEKLAGQIVALGDDSEDAYVMKPQKTPFKDVMLAKYKDTKFRLSRIVSKYKNKLAFSEIYVFSKLFPKTMAETVVVETWNHYAYEELWLGYHACKYAANKGTETRTINVGGKNVTFTVFKYNDSDIQKSTKEVKSKVKNDDGTETEKTTSVPVYYSIYDYNCCAGYTHENAACRVQDTDKGDYQLAASNETNTLTIDGKKYSLVLRQSPVHSVLKNTMFQEGACPASSSQLSTVANVITGITTSEQDGKVVLSKSASDFCSSSDFKGKCSGCTVSFNVTDGSAGGTTYKNSEDADEDEEGEEMVDKAPRSSVMGTCSVSKNVSTSSSSGSSSIASVARPSYPANWCTNYRDSEGHQVYYGMTNAAATTSIDCQPMSGYVVAANNEKFASLPCAEGQTLYAAFNSITNTYSAVCTATDFNEYTQKACGAHSVYAGGTTCECVSGWTKNASGDCSVRGECPKGTQQASDGTCITNPPIIKAKKFCELVDKNWNLDSKNCDTFTNGVYTSVYNAALGNDSNHVYLSINSKPNAFRDITPNMVLANGLRIWILGDKAASVPGLSYFPENFSKSVNSRQNMCERVSLTSHTEAACKSATSNKGYFCSNDKNCFKLDNSSYATGTRTVELKDARGCCSSTDFTDLHTLSEAAGDSRLYLKDPTVYAIGGYTIFVDINGSKGEGTLWDDVFPFYISSNGTVYPGYPLDSEKAKKKANGTDTGNSLYLGGNSDKQLPVDVYYYEASSSGESREKKVAFANVSYARGMCSARKISKYTPYCMNLGKRYKGKGLKKTASGYTPVDLPENYIALDASTNSYNPCDYFVCYVSVKNKLRFF